MQFTKHLAEGCVGLRIEFLTLFDYQIELLCLELWSLQKSKTCASSFEGKELCPPHEISPEMETIADDMQVENKSTQLKRTGNRLGKVFDGVCSNACPELKNAKLHYFKFSKAVKNESNLFYALIATIVFIYLM